MRKRYKFTVLMSEMTAEEQATVRAQMQRHIDAGTYTEKEIERLEYTRPREEGLRWGWMGDPIDLFR